MFYSDVQVRGRYPLWVKRYWERAGIHVDFGLDDEAILAQYLVDFDDEGNGTYDRSRKKSFYWYQRVIASKGEDLG